MNNRSDTSVEDLATPPPTPRWKGRDSLDVVYRFNQRCFQLISEVVADEIRCVVPAIEANRELWANLDDASRKRAARFPFVVLDARFTDAIWWRRALDGDVPASPSLSYPTLAEKLMEETLLLAAQTVNWDAAVARLTLGMSCGVAQRLKGLAPQQLADIWRQHSGELRLRWEQQPHFWRALLLAARYNDRAALDDCRTDAQLLFCADMLHARN